MSSTLVSASLLSADILNLEKDLKSAEESYIDWHHVDVMDGHFVPNLTFGPPLVHALKKVSKLPLDVHLMISNPEEVLSQYLEAGADCLTFHVEATKNQKNLLQKIRNHGARSGLSLKPKTSVKEILPYLEDLDLILIMSVEPGFSGQNFLPDSIKKIEELRNLLKKYHLEKKILISVDGGVSDQNAKALTQAGARCLVTGSYFYKAKDRKQSVAALKQYSLEV